MICNYRFVDTEFPKKMIIPLPLKTCMQHAI